MTALPGSLNGCMPFPCLQSRHGTVPGSSILEFISGSVDERLGFLEVIFLSVRGGRTTAHGFRRNPGYSTSCQSLPW